MLLRVLFVLAGVLMVGSLRAEDAATDPAPISYYRQVRPVIQRHCSGCHQPAKASGKLLLTTLDGLKAGGENGAGITPGQPDKSLLVQYISGEKPEMPLGADPLKPEQIAVIRQWIEQGAKDDTPASQRETITSDHPPVYHKPPVITALAFSPDSQLLAVSGHHEVLLHQADGNGLAARLIGRSPRINAVQFSPNGQMLAAVGGAPALFGEVQLWDVGAKQLKQSATFSFDTLFGCAFSDDGQQLSFGSFDNKARVINVADAKLIMSMDAHSDLVFATTFSLKNDHLISVSRDMSMKLTEIKTAQFIDNITSITPGALKGGLMTVQRHPKEEQVLIGGSDGEPKLYKIFRTQARQIGDDFNKITAYKQMPGRVVSVQFNIDGTQFVAGSSNATSGAARIYRTGDAAVLFELPGHKAGVFAVAYRPDGKVVATGGLDGIVRLFNTENGQLLKEFVPVTITPAVAAAQ